MPVTRRIWRSAWPTRASSPDARTRRSSGFRALLPEVIRGVLQSSLVLGAPLLETSLRRSEILTDLISQGGYLRAELEQLEVNPPFGIADMLRLSRHGDRGSTGGARHERGMGERRGHRL